MARSSAKLAGQSTVIFGMPDKKYRVHHAVMRRAVRTDHARAVDGKDNMQSAQRHIVQQLVVGALEKARIHGEHRERALLGKARRHRGGVSRRCRRQKAVGETPGKGRETRAVLHRRGDRAHARVLPSASSVSARAEDGGKSFPFAGGTAPVAASERSKRPWNFHGSRSAGT